eukprot:CAMPEP_0178432528 /NCGR_PEP_ID=MMETSP0689_2-20121128/32433_1 /TAXON_ID=160604 /ORGANISM="Amphidinium massartii, Strain CS-259" /LENGTH=496 /DNA_ID=CAMNT_0020054521 /DNA_START=179 /DNA_END=1666 /DNA_ORIENTATION=-
MQPSGDQPRAIEQITQEFRENVRTSSSRFVTLAGATGTGKTFVMAHLMQEFQCASLVLCPTKVLAQQQWAELKELLPDASVRLFQSRYNSFSPRCVCSNTGELLPRVPPSQDSTAARLREAAVASLTEDADKVVVVASIAALFDLSTDAGLKLDYSSRLELCKRIEDAWREHSLSLSEERQRRLKKMLEKDKKMLQSTGTCSELYEKYGAYLPESARRRSYVQHMHDLFGPKGWMAFIDESHQMLRAIKAMKTARESRLERLIEEGYQLPDASSEGVLSEEGFWENLPVKTLCVSATPALQELYAASKVVQMVVRPTHIIDPQIEVKEGSPADFSQLIAELRNLHEGGGQVLLNCRTHKKVEEALNHISETLPDEFGGRLGHLRHTLPPSERAELLKKFNHSQELRLLAGVGMLAEGLSFPNVSLVIVMEADRGGLFRSEEKLTQFAGRATRNPAARVIFFVSRKGTLPFAVQSCIDKSAARRRTQQQFNEETGSI